MPIPTINITCSRHPSMIGTGLYCLDGPASRGASVASDHLHSMITRQVIDISARGAHVAAVNSNTNIVNVNNSISNSSNNRTPDDVQVMQNYSLLLHNRFVFYGEDPLIGKGIDNIGNAFINEIVNTIRANSVQGILRNKYAIYAYNRELCDQHLLDLSLNLRGLLPNTTPVTLNLHLFDLRNNHLDDGALNEFLMGFSTLNIKHVDLSSNKLTDFACTSFFANKIDKRTDSFTEAIDLYNNRITEIGYGSVANTLSKSPVKNLKICLHKLVNASKQIFHQAIKSMLNIARNNGIHTKEILTTRETIEHCKKGVTNVALNIFWGYLKCTNKDVMVYNYKDITLSDVAIPLVGNLLYPPLSGAYNFVCITESTIFSVVDDNFANCLVGVENMLE